LIKECLQLFTGIGSVTEKKIKDTGIYSWDDCLNNRESLPLGKGKISLLIKEIEESLFEYENRNISYLLKRFPQKEVWRVLAEFMPEATFFDIETTGLSFYESHITVISAFFKGEIYVYQHDNNLADFLDLVERSTLLVTFNGKSFDVPFVERTFNLPSLDVPHIDLRWVLYHFGYSGGLKKIEKNLGLFRPEGIKDIDGFEAVDLYYRGVNGEKDAFNQLMRYCNADVIATKMVAEQILIKNGVALEASDQSEMYELAMNTLAPE